MHVTPPPYDGRGDVAWEQYLLQSAHEAENSPWKREQRMRALHSSRLFAGARLHLPAEHSLYGWLTRGAGLQDVPCES